MKKYFIRYEGMFWKPNASGYTYSPFDAGIYSEGQYGIRGNDIKIAIPGRGDYAVEVGQMLRDLGYKEDDLEAMKEHLDSLKEFLAHNLHTIPKLPRPLTQGLLMQMSRKANAATGRLRKLGYKDGSGGFNSEEETFCLTDETDYPIFHARMCENQADAEFSAVASPENVRSLCARIAELEEAISPVAQFVTALKPEDKYPDGPDTFFMTIGKKHRLEWKSLDNLVRVLTGRPTTEIQAGTTLCRHSTLTDQRCLDCEGFPGPAPGCLPPGPVGFSGPAQGEIK